MVEHWVSVWVTPSDQVSEKVTDEVHMLIGADFCNEILHGKREIEAKSTWGTEIGSDVSQLISARA